MYTILVILYITNFCNCFVPEVTIKDGRVRGQELRSRNNRTFYAFRGIPYAEPPIGELRFKEPHPVTPWNGTFMATHDGPLCLQKNTLYYSNRIEGEEDCLYLNVYVPGLPCEGRTDFPVLVYIHYGGFFAGSGGKAFQGPEYFMDKDVILVTFNYRLGVFGFLSTGDDAAPGNWGLKDQTAALKWVRENIKYFGGNRRQVTIFGQSAGAVSVHYHMLSPLSTGLFHRAISQSGTALSSFARPLPWLALLLAKQEAAFVGCNENDTFALIDCLRSIDAHDLLEAVDNFKFFADEPSVVFMPAIEKRSDLNKQPFLTQDPAEIIKSGLFTKVPWIIGAVKDEGLVKAGALLRQPNIRKELILNFDNYGPRLLGLDFSTSPNLTDYVWNKLKKTYIKGENINLEAQDSLQGFVDLYGDRFFNYPTSQTIDLHFEAGHERIWFYIFNYKGKYTYGDYFAHTQEGSDLIDWGVSHCDDLLYLFSCRALFRPLSSQSSDLKLSEDMVEMWTNFATLGNPTLEGREWTQIYQGQKNANSEFSYLNITGSYDQNFTIMKMNYGNWDDRISFWKTLPLTENTLYSTDFTS